MRPYIWLVLMAVVVVVAGAWLLMEGDGPETTAESSPTPVGPALRSVHGDSTTASVLVTRPFDAAGDRPVRPGGDRAPPHPDGENLLIVDPEGLPVPYAELLGGPTLTDDRRSYQTRIHADARGIVVVPPAHRHRYWFCRHGEAAGWVTLDELRLVVGPVLRMRRPMPVVVTVVTEDERPAPGVFVSIGGDSGSDIGIGSGHAIGNGSRKLHVRTLVTNDLGEARFEIQPSDAMGRFRTLSASTDMSTSEPVPYNPEGETRLTLRVPPGRQVTLRAVDGMGEPRAIDWPCVIQTIRRWHDGKERVTEEATRWLRGGTCSAYLAPDTKAVSALAAPLTNGLVPLDHDAPRRSAEPMWHQLTGDPTLPLVVPIDVSDVPALVFVPLLDPAGLPLLDTVLRLQEGARGADATTDGDGVLCFRGGPAREVVVAPRTPWSPPFSERLLQLPATAEDVTLAPVQLAGPCVVLAGRVVDHDGRPLRDVLVKAGTPSGGTAVRSEVDGSFAIHRSFFDGKVISVQAITRDGRHADPIEVPDSGPPVELVVRATGSLRGSVLATVVMPRIRIQVTHRELGRVSTAWNTFRDPTPAGRFELGRLPSGIVDIHVEAEGCASILVSSVEVPVGGVAEPASLQGLAVTRDAPRLEVRVRDAGGRPLEGVFLSLHLHADGLDARIEEALTDRKGCAVLRTLPGCTSVLLVEGSGWRTTTLVDPESPVDVVLDLVTFQFALAGGEAGTVSLRPWPPGEGDPVRLTFAGPGWIAADCIPGSFAVTRSHADGGSEDWGRLDLRPAARRVTLGR